MKYSLDTEDSVNEYISCIDDGSLRITKQINNIIYGKLDNKDTQFQVSSNINQLLPSKVDDVINGKDKQTNIVNIAYKNNAIHIFKETNGIATEEVVPFKQFVLSPNKVNNTFTKLKGPGHYRYRKYYSDSEFKEVKPKLYRDDFYFIANNVESFMIDSGVTYYKNLKLKGVSILSFDLETTTIDPTKPEAKILCIGSTYRNNGGYERKLFSEDNYSSQKEMIQAWASWVIEKDPSILTGYNIYLFDIPYLLGIADKHKFEINLGRDNSAMQFENRRNPRKIRKDGSQEYDYQRPEVWGRDIVDMWIVTLKADQATKKYDSYALKSVIKVEGLEKEGRTHYDASKIKDDWHDLNKRRDICQYCIDDSEDPIKLFDLMATPFFLITAYIPKPFQIVTETNTGGQINSLLVRSYLQDGWSIPKGQEISEFQGAISYGSPGLYKNAMKVDVSSLYPSIMRQYQVKPASDYLGNFLKMLEYFTLQRFENKKLAKTTGDKYYDDLQGTQKIFINSSYGFLTTKGLNFNDMNAGSSVTRYGREVLEKSITWATGRTYQEINPKEVVDEES